MRSVFSYHTEPLYIEHFNTFDLLQVELEDGVHYILTYIAVYDGYGGGVMRALWKWKIEN